MKKQTLMMIIFIVVCVIIITIIETIQWNDGRCDICGGTLEYVESIRTGQGGRYTHYLFECDSCGAMKEFATNMQLNRPKRR